MSVAREVKTKFNVDVLARVAERLGYKTSRNANAYGYWEGRSMGTFPLVVHVGGGRRFDIGVSDTGMMADWDGGLPCATAIDKILPAYVEDLAQEAGYSVQETSVQGEEIVIRLG